MIHDWMGSSGTVQDFITLLKMVWNLKHELFISDIFCLIFLDQGWLQATETMDNGGQTTAFKINNDHGTDMDQWGWNQVWS